jgi:hypothetical protein
VLWGVLELVEVGRVSVSIVAKRLALLVSVRLIVELFGCSDGYLCELV